MTDYLDQNLMKLLKQGNAGSLLPHEQKAEMLSRLLDDARTTPIRRHSLGRRTVIAASVLVAVVLAMQLFLSSGSAFARALEHLRQRGYHFTYWQPQADGELIRMGQGMALQPGLVRFDLPEDEGSGLALVVDALQHQTRWVTTGGKDLGEVEVPDSFQDQAEMNPFLGSVEALWDLVDGTETSIGSVTREGVKLQGYEVQHTHSMGGQSVNLLYRIWVNVATGLPHELHMEMVDPGDDQESYHIVFREFDFDAPIDESLFGLGPNSSSVDSEASRYIIEPGAGMGPVRFGMSFEEVKRLMGQPDYTMGERVLQYSGFVLTSRDGKTLAAIACGDLNRADSPFVDRCICRTTQGVGMGSSLRQILTAYGEPPVQVQDETVPGATILRYPSDFMEFRLKDDKVYFMYFGTPQSRE